MASSRCASGGQRLDTRTIRRLTYATTSTKVNPRQILLFQYRTEGSVLSWIDAATGGDRLAGRYMGRAGTSDTGGLRREPLPPAPPAQASLEHPLPRVRQ